MRLIDADALNAWLNESLEYCAGGDNPYYVGEVNALQMVKKYVNKDMQTVEPVGNSEQLNGWISVEDRLPEVGKDNGYECEVLAVVSGRIGDSKYEHGITLMTYSKTPHGHAEWFQSDFLDAARVRVHYWMPLPELPKEAESND